MLRTRLLSLTLLLGLCSPSVAQDDVPGKKEVSALVDEYFTLDWKDPSTYDRQEAILERLDRLPPLEPKDAKRWRKDLLKLWEKGPELPKRGSRHYLWEEQERGLYFLAGKTKKPAGLFIGMHGGGEGSGDAAAFQSFFGGAENAADWVALFPEVLERTERGWTDAGTEEFVLELIERAVRTFGVDRDHIYLGGHSMGGYGTWTLGAHHADLVAGLIPSAGAPSPYMQGSKPVDLVEGVIPNLRSVPMVIYQSADDPRVPPDVNRLAVKKIGEARERWGGYADSTYWEVDGRGHDAPPGGMKALVERIKDHTRPDLPERVVWQPVLPWVRQSYWLYWTRPVKNATVVADLDRETNSVRVELGQPGDGFYVLLSDELLDLGREVTVYHGEREVFRGLPRRTLSALLATARRGDPELSFDVRIPMR